LLNAQFNELKNNESENRELEFVNQKETKETKENRVDHETNYNM